MCYDATLREHSLAGGIISTCFPSFGRIAKLILWRRHLDDVADDKEDLRPINTCTPYYSGHISNQPA